MTKHLIRSLKTSVFTAILYSGLSLGASGSGLAAQALMNPVTGWSVSKVGTERTPGYYCTLARRYDDNAIITVGENVKKDTSIAVEFEQALFKKEQTYDVSIETSDNQRRTFQINPVTTKAFIARVNDDDQFYNSFWNSTGLLISINGQTYSFKTDDIRDGKGQMQLCLGVPQNMNEEQVSQAPAITTTRISSAEIPAQDLAQMEALRQDNAKLSEALKREQDSYELKAAQIEASQSAKVIEATKKLSALEEDNQRLQQELQGIKAPAEELKKLQESLGTELTKLRSENEQLKVSLNETHTKTAKSEDQLSALMEEKKILSERLEALKVSNNQRDQELNSAKSSEMAQLEALSQSLETLMAENAKLKEDLSKQQANNANIKGKQAEMLTVTEAALQAVQDEKKQLEVKLQDITAQKQTTAQNELIAAQKELESLRRENASMVDQLANMRMAEQKNLRSDNDQSEKMQAQVAQLSEQLEQISMQKQDLQEQLNKLTQERKASTENNLASQGDNSSLEVRYQEAELEIKRMAALLEQQRQQFEGEKSELENMLFDPAVAEREQISYLAQLEKNLDLANKALEEQRQMYEERIVAVSNGASLSEVMPIETTRVASVTEPRAARASDTGMLREMSEEIERLRGEVKRLAYKEDPVDESSLSVPDEQPILDETEDAENTQLAETAPKENKAVQLDEPEDSEEIIKAMEEDMEIVFIPEGTPVAAEKDKAAKLAAVAEAEDVPEEAKVEAVADAVTESVEKKDVESKDAVAVNTPEVHAFSVAQTLAGVLDRPMPFANAVTMLQKTDPSMKITDTSKGILQWTSDAVSGASIQNSLTDRPFEKTVNQLVETLQKECHGKLEMEPVVLRKSPTMNLFVYDAVCNVTNGDKTAASLIFYSKDGADLMTISHEGTFKNKEVIVKKRDDLLDMLLAG